MNLGCSSWRMDRDSVPNTESEWDATDISLLLSRKEVTQEIHISKLQGVENEFANQQQRRSPECSQKSGS